MRPPVLALAASALLAGCVVPDLPEAGDPASLLEGLLPLVERVTQIDPARWSGEPSILALDDGTLLVTGVGGLTRYAEDPLDAPGNAGQSYLWRSTDGGATWRFVDLGLPQPVAGLLPYRNAVLGIEGDLAKDEAGRAYFVDLTFLATNGLSVSRDGGKSWLETQNAFIGGPGTDRPWVAAFGDGQVYVKYLRTDLLVSGEIHVARSEDAGRRFVEDVVVECGQADLVADAASREVLLPCVADGKVYVLRTAEGPMDWERIEVADAGDDAGLAAADFPALAVAGPGQYVVAWREGAESGTAIRYAASVDRGATWTEVRTAGEGPATRVFPWLDANADGAVALVWYETDVAGDPNAIDGAWFPKLAALRLDPTTGDLSVPAIVTLTEEKIHQGSICTSGLRCVLEGRSNDRRLLDFFEVDVDAAGVAHVAFTSTMTSVPTVWYAQARLA